MYRILLLKGILVNSVVDKFLMKLPGVKIIIDVFGCTAGILFYLSIYLSVYQLKLHGVRLLSVFLMCRYTFISIYLFDDTLWSIVGVFWIPCSFSTSKDATSYLKRRAALLKLKFTAQK